MPDIDPRFTTRLDSFNAQRFAQWRWQLKMDMSGLQKHVGLVDASDVQRQHGIRRDRVRQFEHDSWSEISRQDLFTLMCLERDVRDKQQVSNSPLLDPFCLFSIVPNPIWRTFVDREGTRFIGRDKKRNPIATDWAIASKCEWVGLSLHEPGNANVPTAMNTTNCLFVGSPKYNGYTKAALESLWHPEPPPIRFLWPDYAGDPSVVAAKGKGPERVLQFRDHKGHQQEVIDHTPNEPDKPAGALIIRRYSRKSTQQVTTVIAAGCSKFGTLRIVGDLLSGNLYVDESQLSDSTPLVFILQPQARGSRWYKLDTVRLLTKKRAERRRARKAH